jgi:FolB domain-containing protein
MRATLRLDRLRASVRLGWEDEERRAPQPITIDVTLNFPSLPSAAESDDLQGTVDYAAIAAHLTALCGVGEYRLLEKLCRVLYDAVRTLVPPEMAVEVTVTKRPPLAGLEGGAAFTIADSSPPLEGAGGG